MKNIALCKNIVATTTSSGRVYHTPKGDFPSITTILGRTSSNNIYLEKWKQRVGIEEANRISKKTSERGDKVHNFLEQYWLGNSISLANESDDVKSLTNQLICSTQKKFSKFIQSELAVWSDTLHVAGRFDALAIIDNKITLVDYKTSIKSKKATPQYIKDYYLQCTFYVKAINQLFGLKVRDFLIFIAVEQTGKIELFPGKAIHYYPELVYRINEFKKLEDN